MFWKNIFNSKNGIKVIYFPHKNLVNCDFNFQQGKTEMKPW